MTYVFFIGAMTIEKRQDQPVTLASYFYTRMEIFPSIECEVNLKVQSMCINWGIRVGEVISREQFNLVQYVSKTN